MEMRLEDVRVVFEYDGCMEMDGTGKIAHGPSGLVIEFQTSRKTEHRDMRLALMKLGYQLGRWDALHPVDNSHPVDK